MQGDLVRPLEGVVAAIHVVRQTWCHFYDAAPISNCRLEILARDGLAMQQILPGLLA